MLVLIFALLTHASATGWHSQNEAIWDVQAQIFVSLAEMRSTPGEIFVFGEEHAEPGSENDPGTYIHHHNQFRLIQHLETLRAAQSVSVGMEFLTYTLQALVDQFVAGVLPEADFLKQVSWAKNPFEFYREQILAPRGTAGRTVALNIPADVAAQVAKDGKDSLSPTQKALTPPLWERGNDAYFERFNEAMKDHAPPDAIEKYFWAQSLWDDTMAWRAVEHRKSHPEDVLVIVVGLFHVQYGGGLPFELKKQTGNEVKTVLQIETTDWATSTLNEAIRPDPKYGMAADYLWLHNGVQKDLDF